MKKTKATKIFNGCVSVRDYIVEEAIGEGGLIIDFYGIKMYLTPDELQKGEKEDRVYVSKYGLVGKDKRPTYQLVVYPWKSNQQKLL